MIEFLALAASLATTLGILVAIYQLIELRRQTKRNLEDVYIHRYWELMDRLPAHVLAGQDVDVADLTEEQLHAAVAYLRLCDDEAALQEEGWITRPTWLTWQDAILVSCGRRPFAQILSRHEVQWFNPSDYTSLMRVLEGAAKPR